MKLNDSTSDLLFLAAHHSSAHFVPIVVVFWLKSFCKLLSVLVGGAKLLVGGIELPL